MLRAAIHGPVEEVWKPHWKINAILPELQGITVKC